jgi:predicted nuclease with RNAse H fold
MRCVFIGHGRIIEVVFVTDVEGFDAPLSFIRWETCRCLSCLEFREVPPRIELL